MQNRFVLRFNVNCEYGFYHRHWEGYTTTWPYDEDMELLNKDNLNRSPRKSYFDGFENTAHIAFCMLTALGLLLSVLLLPLLYFTSQDYIQTNTNIFR